jgi:exodeoxyribonuclease VII small subunit
MTFEEAITALEQSVRRLEGNSLGLEQSLEEYAKAVAYVTHCQNRLGQAKQKIEQLRSVSKSGEVVATTWQESASEPESPTLRRRKSEP